MATTPLNEAAVPPLDYPDLIRRAWAGERVTIHDGIHPDLILTSESPAAKEQQRQELRRKTLDLGPEFNDLLAHIALNPLDPSMEATLDRARKAEEEHGEPIRMGAELADALEAIIAERKPIRIPEWD